jgi:hypothetical protein
MLTDSQVDELEAVIFGASMENLPLVLGKAIPLLFAELRVVRATMDSKVNDFLGEIPDDKEGNADGRSDQDVRGRTQDAEPSASPVRGVDKSTGTATNTKKVRPAKARKQSTRRPRRNKKSDSKDQTQLDTSTGKQALDSKQGKQSARTRKSSKQDASVVPDLSSKES